jgi:poly-gamma-glutamate system protein
MKKMYWTAYNVHPILMIILCVISLSCLYVVETNKEMVKAQHYDAKLQATHTAQKAFEAIKQYRLNSGFSIDNRFDLSGMGLIGEKNSSITSDHGVLQSKQIATNPNLAALIVEWLDDLNLKPGDTIAIGMTGSFPGLDISTLAAAKALKLKPMVIVSAAGSQWGANVPHFSILDMLALLNNQHIIDTPVLAASIGGAKDLGKSLDPKGVRILEDTIKRYDIDMISEPRVSKSITKRLSLYKKTAGKEKIKAYINIGGGVASIGKHFTQKNLTSDQKEDILKHSLKTGPNTTLPVALADTNSVAVRFLKQGTPVINVKNISLIAAKYNLEPWHTSGEIGKGALFFNPQYNLWYAGTSLVLILGLCWLLVKLQLVQKRANDDLLQQSETSPIL